MALTVGLVCAAALLLLLATPVHVHLALERDRSVDARVRVSWLFGLVRLRVHPRGRTRRAAKRRGARPGARSARRVARGMLRPDLRARSFSFLRDVLGAVRPRDVRLRARIGMEDPADTGQLWAVLGPLGALLSRSDVRLEPDFRQACFRFQAAARVRLIPAQLLLLTLAFLVSPPVLRTLVTR